MGNLTDNLSRSEIKCKCGKCNTQTIDFELILVFQEVCNKATELLGKKAVAIITSGCRCEEHNKNEGGKPNSYHLLGLAIDFYFKGISISEQKKLIELVLMQMGKEEKFDIAVYDSFIHLERDVRRIE